MGCLGVHLAWPILGFLVNSGRRTNMILIQFPDRETEIKGLAILMSRFSGKVLRGGLHIIPEPALEALTAANIPYAMKGPATYEHEVAALRGDAASTIQ